MRKKIILILGIVLLILLIIPKEEQQLRIRIKANDDSNASQKTKQEVVLVVSDYINNLNLDNPEEQIINYIDDIKTLVDEINKDATNEVVITNEMFPTKTLDNSVISGGRYKTLLITLGEGNGKNWWSILYPEFYNISFEDISTGEVEYRSYIFDFISKIFS